MNIPMKVWEHSLVHRYNSLQSTFKVPNNSGANMGWLSALVEIYRLRNS